MAAPPPCLDLVNTRYWRGEAQPTETLATPADLSKWLRGRGARLPAGGVPRATHASVLELRETMYAVLDALAINAAPPPRAVAALNDALAAAPARSRLAREGKALVWEKPRAALTAESILSAELWSAADLATGPQRARLRRCANPACGWLFLDESRAAKRLWCFMESCGNRAKARRHYAKHKGD